MLKLLWLREEVAGCHSKECQKKNVNERMNESLSDGTRWH